MKTDIVGNSREIMIDTRVFLIKNDYHECRIKNTVSEMAYEFTFWVIVINYEIKLFVNFDENDR